jgi:hypothetical protein
MEVAPPTAEELEAAIATAARLAIASLFQSHPGRYYYLVLVTTGEAAYPFLSAWSEEALSEVASHASDPAAQEEMRWSYADSPFCCYGLEYFEGVKALFAGRPRMDPSGPASAWHEEWQVRVDAMANALAALDAEGLFGAGSERHRIFINVEVAPPDDTNVERAVLLNPAEAALPWLRMWAIPPHSAA